MIKRTTHPLGIFIIGIHLLYFFIANQVGSIYLVDSFGYLNQAKNILLHNCWYAEEWNATTLIDYFTIRPPFYAFFLYTIKLFFTSDYVVLFIQNLMSIFNIFLLWKMLEQQKIAEKIIKIILVSALILYPSQLIHANLIMTEMLFQTLLIIIFYFSVELIKNPTIRNAFFVSVALSFAMLTKPVIILFGIVLFVYFLFIHLRQSKIFLLPFLLIPLTYHILCKQNEHTTGYYHYSSIKVMADLRVNARYILAQKYGEDSSANFVTSVFKEADGQPDYQSRYTSIEHRCNEVYLQNKITYLMLYCKGVVSTLIDPGRFDLSVFFGLQNNKTQGLLHRLNTEGISALPDIIKKSPVLLIGILGIILLWNILLCYALFRFCFNKRIEFRLRLLVMLFIFYLVAVTGISGLCRYRVPVYPELIFAFSFFASTFFNKKPSAKNV